MLVFRRERCHVTTPCKMAKVGWKLQFHKGGNLFIFSKTKRPIFFLPFFLKNSNISANYDAVENTSLIKGFWEGKFANLTFWILSWSLNVSSDFWQRFLWLNFVWFLAQGTVHMRKTNFNEIGPHLNAFLRVSETIFSHEAGEINTT